MGDQIKAGREGSLEAPTRHPLDWKSEDFWNEESLYKELERVYDICHGCRRCVSLCNSFPVLFDHVDESSTGELDSVPKEAYWDVVDHCYLCDMCYLSKCPYVPPHPWNLDFPHLMLRAKAVQFRKGKTRFRDKLLTSTDLVGSLAGIPVISEVVNAANRSKAGRALLDKTLGVHPNAPLPEYHSDSFHKREKRRSKPALETVPTEETTGKVVVFATCYGNRNLPSMDEDLVAVLNHNGIPVTTLASEKCCGMPKLELGDLQTVEKLKDHNVPQLAKWVDEGWDIVVPVPSCALMFKQELPLIFPDDEQVKKVQARTFDPFEYLMLRHKGGKLRTDFRNSLGKVSYHVPCHLRVQRIGLKTRDALKLVPDTTIEVIERCSGHNGTYAVKREYHETSARIGRPVVQRVEGAGADHYSSDCPMAGDQIAHGLADQGKGPEHPLTLLRHAYGI
jgi:glycerol-3-phosphate dehydrogenase subunit C